VKIMWHGTVVIGLAVLLVMAPLAVHAGDPRAFVGAGAQGSNTGADTFRAQTRPAQPFQGFNPQGFQGFNPQGGQGFNPPVVRPGPPHGRHHHHPVFAAPPPVFVVQSPPACWAPGYWGYQWVPLSYSSGYYAQVWVPERWVC
jgi:hypothetical protein